MHTTLAIAGGLMMTALPFGAVGAIDNAMAPRSTSTAVTVSQIPGSPALPAAQAANSITEWVGGPDGTGLFAVGAQTSGAAATIPVGRYEVKVAPNAHGGTWMLCGTALCGPAFQENATVIGRVAPPRASTIYIGPKSGALWVEDVVLTPMEPGIQVEPADETLSAN